HWDAEHQLRVICVERGEGINRAGNDGTRSASTGLHAQAQGLRSVATAASAGAGAGGTSLHSLEARRSGVAALAAANESTTRDHYAYDYDPFGRRIAKYPISEAAANAWIEHGDEAALAKALKSPHRVGLDPPLSPTRHAQKRTPNPNAPTLFCWDGNRLLAEAKGDTHQLYLYEPDSFVPLAIVRWKAANADAPHAAGSGKGARAANGPNPTSHAATQSTAKATDTDRTPLLPPELLSLKDRYPEQWAKLEAQRRKLARQLGQSPDPEAPTPPKPEVFHVHVDHLGTPREITDTDGHLVWTANYAAWGKAITSNPPRRILTRQGNTVAEVVEEQAEPLECNLRFQGQYADAESGLHYNRFRYYEPDVGRFVSHDPIGLIGGVNLYRQGKNPVNWTDPVGLAPCKPCPCGPPYDFSELLNSARNDLDFSTERSGAVFWSGPRMRDAQAWAAANGKTTLEQTVGGRLLDSMDLFNPANGLTGQQAAEIWNAASLRFANGASGEVSVFSTGATRTNAWGNLRTWWAIEKPALQANPSVESIVRRRRDGTPCG
ncbi:MAG: RHS repeat-associated core domain-containing protein, partial [Fimbriimonadaceae bacterium]